MNDFIKIFCALWLPWSLVTRLGVCVRNKLNANLRALRAFYYDVLLLTTAYSAYALHFFLGQFSNMELMLLLLSLLFLTELLYFPGCVTSVNITLFLTGCLCALNYMSKLDHQILYGWWLLEEGTSRNVPIAGFEMILREDYKSRDEVEGLIFFPKYHFKPQDTGNIPWCSRQQSRHLLYCMATHCLARLWHSSQKFTKLSIFFSGDFL